MFAVITQLNPQFGNFYGWLVIIDWLLKQMHYNAYFVL